MRHEELSLERQLCFPLYACSREVTRSYKSLLERAGLTYTQYVTMMALWEYGEMGVGELGEKLMLDSGTLTPLLKKLEARRLVTRRRDPDDERRVLVAPTDAGLSLENELASVPGQMACRINLSPEEAAELHRLLRKVIAGLEGGRGN